MLSFVRVDSVMLKSLGKNEILCHLEAAFNQSIQTLAFSLVFTVQAQRDGAFKLYLVCDFSINLKANQLLKCLFPVNWE